MTQFLTLVLYLASVASWTPKLDPRFTPDQAERIRASIADLAQCYSEAYFTLAQYANRISISEDPDHSITVYQDIYLRPETIISTYPSRAATVFLDAVLAHEARHTWQNDYGVQASRFLAGLPLDPDPEADAVAFALPVYDRVCAAGPDAGRARCHQLFAPVQHRLCRPAPRAPAPHDLRAVIRRGGPDPGAVAGLVIFARQIRLNL